MRQLFIVFSVFFLFQFAQAQTPTFKTAMDYNNYIIDNQNSMMEVILAFSKEVETGSKESVTNKRLAIIEQAQKVVTNIKKLPGYNNNTSFRDVSVRLFQFYGQIATNEYKEMVDLLYSSGKPEERKAKLTALMEKVSKDEALLDSQFSKEQTDFAKVNDFVLE